MTNLTEKLDELAIQLATQHGAMMVVLNAIAVQQEKLDQLVTIAGNSLSTKLTSAETVARLITTNSILAFMRDDQFTQLVNLVELVDIRQAVANSAISGNANNSVLTAMFGEDAKRLIELKRIADCSCNDGEPTPTSLECEGDYRKVTTFSGSFADPGTWAILYLDDVNQRTEISGIADIAGANTYGGTAYTYGVYGSNKSNIITMDIGDVWCVENVGTALFYVAYAQNNTNPATWEYITVEPGGSTGLNVPTSSDLQSFTILSPVDTAANPDGFKPLLFYSRQPL